MGIIKKAPAMMPAIKRFKVNHNERRGKGALSDERAAQTEGFLALHEQGWRGICSRTAELEPESAT